MTEHHKANAAQYLQVHSNTSILFAALNLAHPEVKLSAKKLSFG
jgi:hypothetical protein